MNIETTYIYNGKLLPDWDIPLKTNINDNIKIHYVLFLEDGTKIETRYDKIPFYFEELGYSYNFETPDEPNNGTIIKGLDKAIMDLTLGDFVRLKIPYQYAYGEKGIPGVIPEKSNLIYYLQLICIERNDNVFEYHNILELDKIVKKDDINEIKKYFNF